MKSPILSIIIPVYNLEKYLKKCLDSIFFHLPDDNSVEIIVINDGSTDDSEKIIEKYLKFDNFKYFSIKNGGVSRARNVGISNSSGEFLTFVDADDFIADNYFSTILPLLEDPLLEILCFGYYEYDGVCKKKISISDGPIIQKTNDGIMNYITFKYQKTIKPFVWNKIYRAKVIKDKKISFSERKYLGEDILFNSEYLQNVTNISCVNAPLYYYFQRHDSVTHKYKENYPQDTINYLLTFIEISKRTGCTIPIQNLLEFYLSRWFGLIYNESFSQNYRKGWTNVKRYLNYDFFTNNKKFIKFKSLNNKNRVYYLFINLHLSSLVFGILFKKNSKH